MKEITVVKIGGNVIDNPEALQDFIEKFAKLEGSKILVHGGAKRLPALAQRWGLRPP